MSDDDFRVHHIRKPQADSDNPLFDFIKKMSSGGGGNGGPEKQFNPLYIFLGVLIVWILFGAFITVETSEQAVITRFGKYNRTLNAGLHLKLPSPLEKAIVIQSKKRLKLEFGFRTRSIEGSRTNFDKRGYNVEGLMLTGDLNVANVMWVVQYRITDPWKYIFKVRNSTRTLRDISNSIMRRVVGDMLVSDVLTTGRVTIRNQAQTLMQELVDKYEMGIKIQAILLQSVNPPDRVREAFNEVNAAKQEQEETINNAEKEYNSVIPEAKGKAKQVIANAEAFAIEISNRAQGDADKFNKMIEAYKLAPNVTRTRMYIETMQDIMKTKPKITILDKAVKGTLPHFNLKEKGAK